MFLYCMLFCIFYCIADCAIWSYDHKVEYTLLLLSGYVWHWAQAPPHCTRCKSTSTNSQCTKSDRYGTTVAAALARINGQRWYFRQLHRTHQNFYSVATFSAMYTDASLLLMPKTPLGRWSSVDRGRPRPPPFTITRPLATNGKSLSLVSLHLHMCFRRTGTKSYQHQILKERFFHVDLNPVETEYQY